MEANKDKGTSVGFSKSIDEGWHEYPCSFQKTKPMNKVCKEHELSRQEIISLGWEVESETVVLENFRYFLLWKGEKHKTAFILNRLKYKPNEIQIYKYGWEELCPDLKTDLFRGVIRTPNELKDVMKFVEILEYEPPIDFHIEENLKVIENNKWEDIWCEYLESDMFNSFHTFYDYVKENYLAPEKK